MHSVEFYFLVSPREPGDRWMQDEFSGKEDYWDNWKTVPGKSQPLIFKWLSLDEIDKINLKPDILKTILNEIPDHIVHIVSKG